jgi:hypothetical protein
MTMPTAELEAMQNRQEELRRRWGPRARYEHDPRLEPSTWMVDGEVQEGPLTEEALNTALLREGAAKVVVTVSAPLHLDLCKITGFMPAYVRRQP